MAVPWERSAGAVPKTTPKSSVPKTAKTIIIATMKPKSPTRFVTNAFLAATALSMSRYQNPTSR